MAEQENIPPTTITLATMDPPVKKRPRTSRSSHAGALRVRKGRTAGPGLVPFDGLPVDVFFEIACLLHPRDLLSLTRVSKSFRSFLLSRRQRGLWTRALGAISPTLPPCPDDMSEPSYAALLFDKHCFLCVVNRSTHVDYALRLRLCTDCYKANVQKGNRVLEECGLSWWGDDLFGMVPCEVPVLTHHGSELERWGEALRKKVKAKEDPDEHRGSDKYFVPALKAALETFQSFPAWSDAQKAFRTEQEARTRKVHEFATELVMWEKVARVMKGFEDRALQGSRANAIAAKLEELGYTRADWPTTLAWEDLVLQTKPLTDRIWNNIRPKLLAMLEEERQRRAEAARQQRIAQRMVQILHLYEAFVAASIPPSARPFTPNLYDASQLPSLVALASSNDASPVTPADFLAAAPRMLDDIDAYKERARAHMLDSMRRDPRVRADLEGVAPEAAMQRHYALFACSACSHPFSAVPPEIMTWAEVNAHWRAVHPGKSWFPDPSKTYDDSVPRWVGCPKYSARMLDGAGVPRDTPMDALDALVREGRLFCACGDPELALPGPDSELSWKVLERHVLHQYLQYARRKKKLRLDLPRRGLTFLATHPLEPGPDCCVKHVPPPADPPQAAFARMTVSPALRARVEARLQERPEPRAVVLCRVCQRLTRRGRVSKAALDSGMKMPETPEGIVWHLRSWHGKEFREDDIQFTTDYLALY